MEKIIIPEILEVDTSVSVASMLRTNILKSRKAALDALNALQTDILSGKRITQHNWEKCFGALDPVRPLLGSALGLHTRVLSFSQSMVENLHTDVLFILKSPRSFFVELFETDEHTTWYFCTYTHHVVVMHKETRCMKSYFVHQLPVQVNIESNGILSSIAVLKSLKKAIDYGFTNLSRLAMRDCVSRN